jgi:hypothetical protein
MEIKVARVAKENDKCLVHMVVGQKVKPLPQADQDAAAAKAKLLTATDAATTEATLVASTAAAKPAAVAAVELMTYTQLEAALKQRGVSGAVSKSLCTKDGQSARDVERQ